MFFVLFPPFLLVSFVGTNLNFFAFCNLPVPTCAAQFIRKRRMYIECSRRERTLTPNYTNKQQYKTKVIPLPALLLSDDCHIMHAVVSWKPELVLLLCSLHSTKNFKEAETLLQNVKVF